MFTAEELREVKTRKDLIALAKKKNIDVAKPLRNLKYEEELKLLQSELVNLQRHISQTNRRVAVLFEGRDAAGKGGSIKRFIEHLNPRSMGVVALTKPTEVERGQWYFQRYINVLPNPGEIVFFDRSWYNRAVVEPVMGFCTQEQHEAFMAQVTDFEHMLYEDGIILIKFWFSISKKEQKKRFDARLENPLKEWKFSPVDLKGQELWDRYTHYKENMFAKTHNSFSPWVIVKANDKRTARLESMRYVLSQFDYPDKGASKISLFPDADIVEAFYRKAIQIDI